VVNLKAQTLSRLKNASSSEGLQLMPLVYQLEPLLAKNSAVQVEEIRWNQSAAQLQLRVSAPQSRQLQQLGQQLDAINGKLTIKNVTPEAALGVINVGTN
jgi:type II secretory pathway component PulL